MFYRIKTKLKRLFEFLYELLFQKQLVSIDVIPFNKYNLTGPKYLLNGLLEANVAQHLKAVRLLINKIKHNREIIIFDVGANIGQISLIFSEIENSKIFSFEPVIESFNLLNKNVIDNNINNITTFPYGLFSEDKQIGMGPPKNVSLLKRFDKKSLGMKSIFTDNDEYIVELKKGDDVPFIINLKSLHILKIDVEGVELEVLKGLKETIKKNSPVILMEYSSFTLKNAGTSKDELISFIKNLDYKFVMNFNQIKNDDWNQNFDFIEKFDFPNIGAPDLIISKSRL